ncbi:hypothetical protein BOW51_09805 [Solemya velesiana gill symbiont]|uniref:Uncharacterized protein n=1 Tax=Solemya velesiana gill symbiont TaxID=1918948 RepID=A0A1T2KT32_9GAMM|nr:hypothetical protein BOW51_09805 [Solemya velesiana gill symbiont]
MHGGDLHIWKLDLSEHGNTIHPPLSSDETRRAEKLRSEDQKKRFVVARKEMRQILAAYLECKPADISFAYGKKGKPAIKFPESDIQFNITHSGDLGLLAVTRGNPVGIDLEPVVQRKNARHIAQRVFDQAVLDELDQLEDEHFFSPFFQYWTSLESRIKAIGVGVFDYASSVSALEAHNFEPQSGWMASVSALSPLPEKTKWVMLYLDLS